MFGKRPPPSNTMISDTTQVLVRRKLQGYRAVGARYSFNVEEQVSIFMMTIALTFQINLGRLDDPQIPIIK